MLLPDMNIDKYSIYKEAPSNALPQEHNTIPESYAIPQLEIVAYISNRITTNNSVCSLETTTSHFVEYKREFKTGNVFTVQWLATSANEWEQSSVSLRSGNVVQILQ